MAVIEGGGRFSQLLNSPFLLFWALVSKAFVVFCFLRKIDVGLKFCSIKVSFSYKVNAKTGERTFPLYFSRLFFDKGYLQVCGLRFSISSPTPSLNIFSYVAPPPPYPQQQINKGRFNERYS